MHQARLLAAVAAATVLILVATPRASQTKSPAQASPTIDQFLGASSPLELVSAKKADRVAWIAYERG